MELDKTGLSETNDVTHLEYHVVRSSRSCRAVPSRDF